MTKPKQCAVCKGYYDPSILVGVLDTFMCDVCAMELDDVMKVELGENYKQNIPRTTSRYTQDEIPVIRAYSPVHPKPTPDRENA